MKKLLGSYWINHKWHPNANNGTVKGRQYFEAPPGRGYFAKRAWILHNLGTPSVADSDTDLKLYKLHPLLTGIDESIDSIMNKTCIVNHIGRVSWSDGEVIELIIDEKQRAKDSNSQFICMLLL